MEKTAWSAIFPENLLIPKEHSLEEIEELCKEDPEKTTTEKEIKQWMYNTLDKFQEKSDITDKRTRRYLKELELIGFVNIGAYINNKRKTIETAKLTDKGVGYFNSLKTLYYK